MSDTRTINLRTLHPGQQYVSKHRERFNVLSMGRRWGKTEYCMDLVTDDPGYGLLDGYPLGWFAGSSKVYDEAWQRMKETLGPITARKDEQQKRIETITGGVIDFWSLDGGDAGGAGRGRKYRRVVVDEAALVPGFLKIWSTAIRPTLIDLQGDAYIISTPRGMQNDFYRLHKRGDPKNKEKIAGYRSFRAQTFDNPYLPPAELIELKKEYIGRPLDYRQEILAEFVADTGAVFKLEWLNAAKAPERFTDLVSAWDLAVTEKDLLTGDYTAGVVIGLDSMGRYWLVDVVRGKWNTAEVVEQMILTAKKYNTARNWYEGGPIGRAIEPWLRKRIKAKNLHQNWQITPHSGRGDKVVRTGPVVAVMANDSFYVPIGATWIDALQEEIAAFPNGDNDDQVDALSLAFLELQAIRESSTLYVDPKELLTGQVAGDVIDEYYKNLAADTAKPRRRKW